MRRLLDGDQVDDEHQCLATLDDPARSPAAIAQIGRNGQPTAAAHLHAGDTTVPSFDDLACAQAEVEGLPTIPTCVELTAGAPGNACIVNDHSLADHRLVAIADLLVIDDEFGGRVALGDADDGFVGHGSDSTYDLSPMEERAAQLDAAISDIGAQWRADRTKRHARRHLDRADFDALRDAGMLAAVAPVEVGGLWQNAPSSLRALCQRYRLLASADPSVALVSSMHSAVVAFWLASPDSEQVDWEDQRRAVFASAIAGEQWGTITSEPGSGGDITRTRAIARPCGGEAFIPGRTYAITGDKHFGSGSGITHRMVTTAIPEGEVEPMLFVLDVRDRPWDGSVGLKLIAEWDGMGMAATQSHAMRLDGAQAVRLAWNGRLEQLSRNAGPMISTLFTAVVLGVLDEAIAVARQQVTARANDLRSYEQVEWTRAELDHWLAVQAYEGALRAVETGDHGAGLYAALRAKTAVAELAEATLTRVNRVLGGGTFSQRSPFAHWFEDVRALGFLRPPWGLAYDGLFASSLAIDPTVGSTTGSTGDSSGRT